MNRRDQGAEKTREPRREETRSYSMAKSTLPQPKHFTSISSDNDRNEGLPNIGLTCFLNSVLQLLYSAQEFRQRILAAHKTRSNNAFLKGLANIFDGIKNKAANSDKEKVLKLFIKELMKLDTEYQMYSCQDALQFLLLILNQLESIDSKLIKHFQITYESTCGCQNSKMMFQTIYLSAKAQICVTCDKELQLTIEEPPKYLICLNSKVGDVDEFKYYNGNNGKQLQYKLCATIRYVGNGRFGHYKATRQVDGQFKILDDSSVSSNINWGGLSFFYTKRLILMLPNSKLSQQNKILKKRLMKKKLKIFLKILLYRQQNPRHRHICSSLTKMQQFRTLRLQFATKAGIVQNKSIA